MIGQDPRAGLRGERGGTGGQRRPGAEQADRDAVAAVAPVDEQAEHLAAPQDRRRSRAGCATG